MTAKALVLVTRKSRPVSAWRVARPAPAVPTSATTSTQTPQKRSWFRFFRRAEPTTYHRCLAVHIHYAAPRSGLK